MVNTALIIYSLQCASQHAQLAPQQNNAFSIKVGPKANAVPITTILSVITQIRYLSRPQDEHQSALAQGFSGL